MKLELHTDLPNRPAYVLVQSDLSQSVRQFFHENGVQTTIEPEVFRSDGHPFDFVLFPEDTDIGDVGELVSRWNATQRAQKMNK